jgi:hypothetical protein
MHQTSDAERNDPKNDYNNSDYTAETVSKFLAPKEHKRCRVGKSSFKNGEKITGPRPWERNDL